MYSKVTQIHYISSMALKLKEDKKIETLVETTKPVATEEDKSVKIKDQLAALEKAQKDAIAKKKEDQAKSIGRSQEAARRVSSSTRISGLRGLEPRLGMQFAKKTND